MIDYIELHKDTKPAVDLLTIEEKAMLLELLFDYGLNEKDISEIDPNVYKNNRVVGAVYQMILNDSI